MEPIPAGAVMAGSEQWWLKLARERIHIDVADFEQKAGQHLAPAAPVPMVTSLQYLPGI